MFAAMPDARTTVTRLVAGEQSCAVEWRIEGTFDGAPYMGIEPTGKHVEIRGLDLFELEDGEIVSNTALLRRRRASPARSACCRRTARARTAR